MKLIPAWKSFWRFWSVRLTLLGTTLTSAVTLFPDAALQAWLVLPQEFKQILPPAYLQVVGIAILLLGIVARVVKQEKLPEPSPADQQ